MPLREKPRLGRGLASLFGEEAAPTTASVLLEHVLPGPFQARVAVEDSTLKELAESIAQHGLLQPILVRPNPATPGVYEIIAGERRWRAARLAGLREIPATIRDFSDHDALAVGLIENLQRQDLNALEEAEGYRRLTDEFRLSQEALAATVGKSRSHVANCLRLLGLPETVKQQVRDGVLSAGHARAALAHKDPVWAARAMIARDLSVRESERLSQQSPAKAKGDSVVEPYTDANTAAIVEQLAERLGLVVHIQLKRSGGVLRIDFSDPEQLDGVLALLMAE